MSPELASETVVTWGLASLRLLTFFLVAPPFAHPAFPLRMRVGLASVLAIAIAPAAPVGAAGPATRDVETTAVLLFGLGEIGAGLVIGLAVRLVFTGFALLGEFVSVQSGIGAASLIDPMSGAASGVLSVLFESIALLLFLSLDGHHWVLRALVGSFDPWPVAGGGPAAAAYAGAVQLGSAVFEIAVRLAAPVTAVMLLSNVALGILGRLVPQLNLMTVQLPAHILVLLALLGAGAAAWSDAAADVLRFWLRDGLAARLGGA